MINLRAATVPPLNFHLQHLAQCLTYEKRRKKSGILKSDEDPFLGRKSGQLHIWTNTAAEQFCKALRIFTYQSWDSTLKHAPSFKRRDNKKETETNRDQN